MSLEGTRTHTELVGAHLGGNYGVAFLLLFAPEDDGRYVVVGISSVATRCSLGNWETGKFLPTLKSFYGNSQTISCLGDCGKIDN